MMEAGVVIDCLGNPYHWHLPPGRSGGALPDSHDLWEVLYKLNNEQAYGGSRLLGFAHSHPGDGACGPSSTDLSTFDAIERGLGRGGAANPMRWWIVNADWVSLTESELWRNPQGKIEKKWITTQLLSTGGLSWVYKLRIVSGLAKYNHCFAGRNPSSFRLDGTPTCDAKPEPYSAFCATHIRDEALVRAYFAP